MTRYFISKNAAKFLNLTTVPAMKKLASTGVITTQALEYKNIDAVNTPLTSDQLTQLQNAGYTYRRQVNEKNSLLGNDYEKKRSQYSKMRLRGVTGRGVKIAVLDTGCGGIVPYDFGVDFADTSGVGSGAINHGTAVAGIIKSTQIGMANGCELHVLKVFNDSEILDTAAVAAAIDYCIDENIDILNMSFSLSFYSSGDPIYLGLASFKANGGVSFAASGNSVTTADVLFPAGTPDVVAVNAVNEAGVAVYKNVNPPSITGGHGIDFACNGIACQYLDVSGIVSNTNGTSYSSPWAVAAFALYKEWYGIADNLVVLQRMKDKGLKQADSVNLNRLIIF